MSGTWHLFASVGICWRVLAFFVPQRCYGVIGGMFGGCLGESELNSWKLEVHKCVWGVYGFSILAVGVKTLFWNSLELYGFLSTDHTETSKYQNRRI